MLGSWAHGTGTRLSDLGQRSLKILPEHEPGHTESFLSTQLPFKI